MKTVLITGSNRGIGLELSKIFLNKEFMVVGTSTKRNTSFYNRLFTWQYLDYYNKDSINDLITYINDKGIRFDIVINNAAVLIEEEREVGIDIENLRKTFEVNVFGPIELTEKLVPFLKIQSTIINITSGWGTFSNPFFNAEYPSYKLSKTCINMYTKILAHRCLNRGVTVIAVDPGWVRTDMGGKDAKKTADQAAIEIYNLIASDMASGLMYYNSIVQTY